MIRLSGVDEESIPKLNKGKCEKGIDITLNM